MRDEGEPSGAGAVSEYVDAVERRWTEGGMASGTRRRLAAELQTGLDDALAAGAPLTDVLAVEASTLAFDVAQAEEVSLTDLAHQDVVDLRGLITWGSASAVVMAGFIWFFALLPLVRLFFNDSSDRTFVISLVLVYGTCALLTIGSAAAGMAFYLRRTADRWVTIAPATLLMTLGGGVGTGLCLVLARQTEYSDAPIVVTAYVLVVGTLMSAGIALAWRWRRPHGTA